MNRYQFSLNYLRVLFAGLTLSSASLAQDLVSNSREIESQLEEEILNAPADKLYDLEHRVARLLQVKSDSHLNHYLMSSLLLRMYLMDPTESDLLRQSAAMASQAYELDPTSDLGIVALANILEVSGEVEKGITLLKEVESKKIRRTWRFDFAKARLLTGEDSTKNVLKLLRSSMAATDALRSVIAPYVLVALLSNGTDGLSAEIQQWNREFPCIEFSLALANIQLREGHRKEALALLADISNRYPNRLEANALLLEVAINETHDMRLAQRILDSMRGKNIPPHLEAEFKMAAAIVSIRSRARKMDMNSALEAIKLSSKPEESLTRIMENLFREKDYRHALEFLREVHTTIPGIASSYGIYGEILLTQYENNSDAVFAFTDAITLDDENSRFYNGRGLAFYGLKQFDLALVDFQFATRIDPSNGSAQYNLACALALTGHEKEAINALANAVDLDERLLESARTDKDFANIKNTDAFQDIFRTDRESELLSH